MFEPEMIFIKPGRFMMGSNGLDNERPTHKVAIAYPFAISQCPVTFDEYDAFCTAIGLDKPDDAGWGRGNRPVINVSWQGAMVYCAWLSQQTGKTYRLPSEAEWEYACRAGSEGDYCFGNDPANLGEYAWYEDNSDYQTHPVGKKQPNAWGLHDMHGNVWEWCEDGWHDNYQGAPADGSAWTDGQSNLRVSRGGSWISSPDVCRTAFRNIGTARYNLGFRMVMVPSNSVQPTGR